MWFCGHLSVKFVVGGFCDLFDDYLLIFKWPSAEVETPKLTYEKKIRVDIVYRFLDTV